jgi:SAM-dependent methyltransferase
MALRDIELSDWVIHRDRRRFDVFVPGYLVKRIRPGESVCSAGCGSGYDVELLCRLGVDAYGFDPGARTALWATRSPLVAGRLKVGFAQALPFGKERFDFVYALEVIEHVGCADGQWQLLPNSFDIRRGFLDSCLDMLKPGGRLFLSTSNRLCPIDIGHWHSYTWLTDFVVRKTRIPLTVPWHRQNFVLSWGDLARLLQATRYRDGCRVKRLPVAGYLAYSRVDSVLVKLLVDVFMNLVSLPLLRASPLNPLLVVEIQKG